MPAPDMSKPDMKKLPPDEFLRYFELATYDMITKQDRESVMRFVRYEDVMKRRLEENAKVKVVKEQKTFHKLKEFDYLWVLTKDSTVKVFTSSTSAEKWLGVYRSTVATAYRRGFRVNGWSIAKISYDEVYVTERWKKVEKGDK